MRKKRNNTSIRWIIFLSFVLIITAIAYARYSSELYVEGIAIGSGKIDLEFANFKIEDNEKGKYGTVFASNTNSDNDTLNVDVKLSYPGEECCISTDIINYGKVPVVLEGFSLLDGEGKSFSNDSISVEFPELSTTGNEIINSKEVCPVKFVVKWNSQVNTENSSVDFKISLDYSQNTRAFKSVGYHHDHDEDVDDTIDTFLDENQATDDGNDEEEKLFEGEGTESNPYLIRSSEEFALFAKTVNEGETWDDTNFLLTVSVDFSNMDWIPVGGLINSTSTADSQNGNRFNGTFDGGNNKVYNVNAVYPDKEAVGLFGTLGEDGIIENLSVISGNIEGRLLVGGIVGANYGTVKNCNNKVNVTARSLNGEDENGNYSGGITGYNFAGGVITDCTNSGNILSTNGNNSWNGGWAAGIAGFSSGDIYNSSNSGNITAKHYRAGGIVGTFSSGTIKNCSNTGEIYSGWRGAGGIVGLCCTNGKIYDCENFGKVVAETDEAGGIAGDIAGDMEENGSYSLLSNCTNNGTVQTNLRYLGGIAGIVEYTGDKIIGCTNNGEVIPLNDGTAYQYRIGGILGDGVGELSNCTNNGNVTAYGQVCGGIVGSFGGKITGCTNTGTITLNYDKSNGGKASTNAGLYCGGIAGLHKKYDGLENILENCENSGTVTGITYTGGIAGVTLTVTMNECNNSGIINGSEKDTAGIVGYPSATRISNSDNSGKIVTQGQYSAGIAAYTADTVITNCNNTADIDSTSTYVGGIVGRTYLLNTLSAEYSIYNCKNTGNIQGNGNYVAGVAGYSYTSIGDCENTGSVNTTGGVSGGICGYLRDKLNNCKNSGNIKSNSYMVGGIAGRNNAGADISNSFNYGDVDADSSIVAGISAYCLGNVEKCANYGNITSNSTIVNVSGKYPNAAGGVIGALISGNVSRVYNEGSVTSSNNSSIIDAVGGIAGFVGNSDVSAIQKIEYAYNKGQVSCEEYAGNIVGQAFADGKIAHCYYLSSLSNLGIGGISDSITVVSSETINDENGVVEAVDNDYSYEEFVSLY